MAHRGLRSRGVIVLASGGIESAVLLARLARGARRVIPVYVRSGHAWEGRERAALARFLKAAKLNSVAPLEEVALPVANGYGRRHWSVTLRQVPPARSRDEAVYLPGRNLFLLSGAALVAARHGVRKLALGVLAGNPFADAKPSFFRAFERAARLAFGIPVRVAAPLGRLSKPQVIHLGRSLPLHLTWSCLRPVRSLHCGRCNKCAERKRGFRRSGLRDRTRYA